MMNKRLRRMRNFAAVMMAAVVMTMTACGGGQKADAPAQNETQASSYETAKDILDVLWNSSSKDFPAFGGNFENNVENEPGELPVDDKDTMTSTLLIPEDVQSHVTGAATLYHMMNTNTFTGAALKLDGITADDAAAKIKDAFKNNQFMCGMPDKIVIYTVGNDLVYCYGAGDVVDDFMSGAGNLEGGKLAVDEAY